ncbi:MFS transporter [Streptomyces sp. HB2AG]|uniref:MFS transporter n=1 Tax=Streptomyces sp. HB2AG TaxID=2983400 RepID=UPI0022AB221C|nr:MFS transporter [Streptomyces sp. HB2AG]MCZ2526462.1 MFS transporter [Streptomyces sp. HB2AG]
MDSTDSDGSGAAPAVSRPPGRPPAQKTWHKFWLLTSAASASELGNTFLHLAMPWTILASTGSPLMAALSLGVQYLPFVASPLLGALIDGYERRAVFMVSELVQGVLVALTPFLLMADQVELVLLVLLVAGCGTVTSNLTSDFSLLPMLAPEDRVTEAYSRFGAATELARCAGPAVAGVVLAAVGGYWALWIDAATFLLTALVALALPRGEKPVVERGFLRMQAEGFRSFRRIKGVPRLTLVLSVYNLGAGAVPTVILVLAAGTWGWSSGWVGVVLATGAAGSALGSWLGGRVWADAPSERRIGLWFAVCAVACVALLAPWEAVVVLGFCALMAGEGGMNVTTSEYRFRAIPEKVSGRVNAVMRAFILGGAALSSLLLGWSVTLPENVLRFAPALVTSAVAVLLWAGVRSARGASRAGREVPEQAQGA